MFSRITLDALRRAGWLGDRKIDTSVYTKALNEEGYLVPSLLTDFLHHYGGIYITHPDPKIPNATDDFHLDPLKAIENNFHEGIEEYGKLIGTELCVFGEASDGYLVLMMAQDGRVFAGIDDLLYYVGESGVDAIEALCTGREFQKIGELPE